MYVHAWARQRVEAAVEREMDPLWMDHTCEGLVYTAVNGMVIAIGVLVLCVLVCLCVGPIDSTIGGVSTFSLFGGVLSRRRFRLMGLLCGVFHLDRR